MKLTTRRQSLVRVGKTKPLGDTDNETASYTLDYDRVDEVLIVRCVCDLNGPNQPQQVYTLRIYDVEFDQMAALVQQAREARK